MSEPSQCQILGKPPVRSWDDYEEGCLSTFTGGHRGAEEGAFRHGMRTIFNLLRDEFPPAEVCKAAPEEIEKLRAERDVLLEACEAVDAHLRDTFPPYAEGESPYDKVRAAIALVKGGMK